MKLQRQYRDARWLVIMAKVPGAGRVKTRLARDIGSSAAANVYRQTCRAVVTRLSQSTCWNTVLCVTPDSGTHDRFWPTHLPKIKQGNGDLGARMRRAIAGLPPGPVVLIGTDIPTISRSHIARAFRALGESDVVFGPAHDGGYWLVGMKNRKPLAQAFAHVRWSTASALSDTLRNLTTFKVTQIDQLNDVDTLQDLQLVDGLYGRLVTPAADLDMSAPKSD